MFMRYFSQITETLKTIYHYVISTFYPVPSSIQTIKSLSDISLNFPEKTIIFIDLDNTVFYPAHPMLSTTQGRKLFHDETRQLDETEKKLLGTLINSHTEWALVENIFPTFLKTLRSRGFLVCGITGRGFQPKICGLPYHTFLVPSEHLPSNAIYQAQTVLNQFSIDFTNFSLNHERLSQWAHAHSMEYKDGILFLSMQSMGDVIPLFLNELSQRFSLVVAIDDELPYLEHLSKKLKESCIPFKGYHYIQSLQHSATFNETLAKEQLRILLKDHQLLSDAHIAFYQTEV